ncbi:MAG: hypothetical protein HQ511_12285 [Rhodospirillales bacterium]|nr:hypothetical protein [Rhodospirillales bacterium]
MLSCIAAGHAEIMEPESEGRIQQVADRLLQSNFGLWNALLTVNGILLAAFSAVLVASPKVGTQMVLALVAACVLSLVLLVYNFWTTKSTYDQIGRVVTGKDDDLSDEKRSHDIDTALSRHQYIAISEKVCLLLLLVEAGLVLAIVFCSV